MGAEMNVLKPNFLKFFIIDLKNHLSVVNQIEIDNNEESPQKPEILQAQILFFDKTSIKVENNRDDIPKAFDV